MKMRIGLATPSWPGTTQANGITTAVSYLADGLRACGHAVTIIPFRGESSRDDESVIHLPPPRRMGFREKVFTRLGRDDALHAIFSEQITAAALEAIESRGIEVLVMEETQGWAGFVQRRLPIPVVVTLHGPWCVQQAQRSPESSVSDNRRERRETEALRLCAAITAPSRDVLRRTEAAYELPPGPRAVLPNSIHVRQRLDYDRMADSARRNILFVGRFDRTKGADILLEGFSRLVQDGTDARLTFVGPDVGIPQPGGGRLQITQALSALPKEVRARIEYVGLRTKPEIDSLRLRHGIAVVASRYENMPYTLLESLATGAATVCAAAGGPAEVVRDGETGLLIPPEDPAALASACRKLIETPGLAGRLGAAAHADVAANYAPPVIAKKMVEFLQSL